MGFLSSLFKRSDARAAPQGLAADESLVERARTSARRRLIGAVLLLGIGVIAFPLIFETQPRPIPVDIPIEIPRQDGAAPLALPASRPAAAAVVAAAAKPTVAAPVESKVAPPETQAKSAPAEPQSKAAPPAPAPKPEAAPAPTPVAATPAVPPAPAPKPSAPAAGRFVVQVGAFADAASVRETRGKVEKIGLATYTQQVETPGGTRTRVRVGPFNSRDEAERAAAKLKAAGLPGDVRTP